MSMSSEGDSRMYDLRVGVFFNSFSNTFSSSFEWLSFLKNFRSMSVMAFSRYELGVSMFGRTWLHKGYCENEILGWYWFKRREATEGEVLEPWQWSVEFESTFKRYQSTNKLGKQG